MEKRGKIENLAKSIFIVPLGLVLILTPYSSLIGWNLITLVLFWFVLVL